MKPLIIAFFHCRCRSACCCHQHLAIKLGLDDWTCRDSKQVDIARDAKRTTRRQAAGRGLRRSVIGLSEGGEALSRPSRPPAGASGALRAYKINRSGGIAS